MVDKPYADGGVEHSGRIAKPGDELYYDVLHQTSAVQLLEGSLNSNETTKWSVEIRMAYLTSKGPAPAPSKGTRWRINFCASNTREILIGHSNMTCDGLWVAFS